MARLQEDVRRLRFWRSLVAEFLGTMFLVLFGCGAWTQAGHESSPDTVKIAFAFGLTYIAVLYCIRNVSDGYINPAVTVALLATRRASVIRSLLYLLCQIIGAILGAAFVFAVTSAELRAEHPSAIGCTVLSAHVAESHGFGVEFFATFFFVFVVFACSEKTRREEVVTSPVIIGLTYGAMALFAIPYTGGSMNPARSFGPALVSGVWAHHWIYWFGPLLGGVTGGATYDLIFSTKASFKRLRACLLVFHKRDGGQEVDQKDPERAAGQDDDTDDDGTGDKKNRNEKGDIEETVDLNADPEKSREGGGEDSKPRTKLFRPKFPCCSPKEGQ